MYRDKQMSWGNVNASGMSEAVNQAGAATALLQEANKGLSGIGDSIAKVGDSMTKYGTDMETRYEKEKNEVIEGIANDIYNSAIADSTDANGRVNLDTFDKVTSMGIANLKQGQYAMNEKDSNAVLKHINSLIDRSTTTKDNVSIMDHNLNQAKFDQDVIKYKNERQDKHLYDYLMRMEDEYKNVLTFVEGLEPAAQTFVLNKLQITKNNKQAVVLNEINNLRKNKNKNVKDFSYNELTQITTNENKLKEHFGEDADYVKKLMYEIPIFLGIEAMKFRDEYYTLKANEGALQNE